MILKSLMEEKQLDFNQPLLSVRKFSSTAASENDNKRKPVKSFAKPPPIPSYKSELKSGPVSNPGTVPFVWEKTPGRPKNESNVERPSIAPKLPPGRVLKVKQQDSDKVSRVTTYTSVTQSKTGTTVSNAQSVASLDTNVTKHETPKELIQEKVSSGSDDEDEAYQDALDRLSRTESLFMSCSVSGLSGWDDQEVQPSGSFTKDQQQARDFMIDRFLPAAKAMASETSQIQHRKPHVTQEQPIRHVKKVVSQEKPRPMNPKWQKVLPHYAQDFGRAESEDESDEHDAYDNYAPKICGLFTRFCLLNPIPGIRMEDRVLGSAAHGMQRKSIASHRRTTKEHARTTYYGKKSVESKSGFTEERNSLGVTENSKHGIDPHRRAYSKSQACESTQCESNCESPVVEKTLYVDSVHKVRSSSSYFSEMKGPTNHRDDDFETLSKDSGIKENPSLNSSLDDSKDLVVVDVKETSQPRSSVSLDNYSNDLQMEILHHSNKLCLEKQGLTKPGYEESNLDHYLAMISSPKMVECKKTGQVSCSEKCSDGQIQNPVSQKNMKSIGDSEVDLKSRRDTKLVDHSTLASSKEEGDGKINSAALSLKLPLALPLPKAPSESWLKRTLPSVSSRNISLWSNHANIQSRSQTLNSSYVDPKWEEIVKSSNVQHGRLRFGEDPLTTIPEA